MKKIFFKNFGCKLNLAELQQYQILAEKLGFIIAQDPDEADLALVNSCHVTVKTNQKIQKYISHRLSHIPIIIITGCFPRDQLIKKTPGHIIIHLDSHQKFSLKHILRKYSGQSQPAERINIFLARTRAFVKIQQGCNTQCAYCIIPHYRGRSRSYSDREIIKKIKFYIQQGVQEIVLTGTNLGKYNYRNHNLSYLLQAILTKTSILRLRVSSIDITDISPQLIKIFNHFPDRLCPHLHLALQSGSDKILKLMRRPYDSSRYIKTIHEIHKKIPNVSITSDIIVGFPQEKSCDFRATCHLIKKAGFSNVHIFTYSEHPNTLSATIHPKVPNLIIKKRYKILSDIADKVATRHKRHFINRHMPVLFEGKQAEFIAGYTPNYLPVRVYDFKPDIIYRNQIFLVKLLKIKKNYFVGKIIA